MDLVSASSRAAVASEERRRATARTTPKTCNAIETMASKYEDKGYVGMLIYNQRNEATFGFSDLAAIKKAIPSYSWDYGYSSDGTLSRIREALQACSEIREQAYVKRDGFNCD